MNANPLSGSPASSLIRSRPEVIGLREAVHGAVPTQFHDGPPLIDFSANLNPYGPSPAVRAAIRDLPIDRYPDRNAEAFVNAAAEYHRVSEHCILPANGSGELLSWIAAAYLRSDDDVFICGPTYAEYARVAAVMGAGAVTSFAAAADRFAFAGETLCRSLRTLQPRVCFLCRPNNPTGCLLPADVVRGCLAAFPATLFVVDEAYLDFVPEAESLIDTEQPNLLVLRSLTKAHGLAGLRLGYAVGHPALIRTLTSVRVPWSVNVAAQAAGIAALGDTVHVEKSVAAMIAEKQTLVTSLEKLGLDMFPSPTPYFLVRVANASAVHRRLVEAGFMLRDCSSFGIPGFLRISPQAPEHNRALVQAWTANC